MEIRNELPKGTVLDVLVSNERIYLQGKSGHLDITNKLSNQERGDIFHLGKAIALVTSSTEINIITYVNFHVHSQYSILDGMSKLPDIAKKSSGITALTDHGNCYGVLKWQKEMHKVGKKPIFGFEAYVESINEEKDGHHLILLAKNEIGKKNLFVLSSNAFYNYHKKPHIKFEDLKTYHEGLICTSACLGGEIARTIISNYEDAKKVALLYQSIFGDDYYLEIQRHGAENEALANKLIIQLSKELNIKLVAANDSHYLNQEDAKYHEILLCINTSKKLSEPHFEFDGSGYWFKTDSEMVQDFWDIPEAITNTYEIAKKCNLEIETGVYHFPKFDIPEGYQSEEEYLLTLIDNGFIERYKGTPMFTDPTYKQRLEYEKNIILSMGFATYFLIVSDYVNWAKDNGILVGPGRGSAAGSLACYCLKITDLDPIKYNLLFERFLNPERISMPDIDMDFQDDRRQEVIDYVKDKYGEDRVCNIITFGTMAAKASVKDAARVISDYGMGDKISRMIPSKPGITLQKALEQNPDFALAYDKDKNVKELVDTARKIEGNTRQTSTHACGIVVSGGPIKDYLPTALVKDTNNKDNRILVSQVTMTEVEELGLLKMDFLGLRTMTVIDYCMTEINKVLVSKGYPPMNYYREIPINDPYVYEEISKGKSFAVFQIESEGMRKFMSELFGDVSDRIKIIEHKYHLTGFGTEISGTGTEKEQYIKEMETFGEELFERMIAGISLYRPGPMDYIPDFLKGIADPDQITYDTPELEPILKPTYGVIVYQEQVMQIVKALAGFTNGQSDTIRKAMGKKNEDILLEYKPYFLDGSGDAVDNHTGKPLAIKGCIENGIASEIAANIWDKMADFAKYAFNKSHAAVYAVITVTCAWCKHYYPIIYMYSILNTYLDDNDKLKAYINVTKNMGIKIFPPSVNKSKEEFSLENDGIRFGLKGLKGLSNNVSQIIKERTEDFKSVQDFVDRTIGFLNKKGYESLIKSGAMDEFGYNRKTLMGNLEHLMKHAQNKHKDLVSGQLSLFDSLLEDIVDIEEVKEYSKSDKLEMEKEFASLYISEHPLDEYRNLIKKMDCTEIGLIEESSWGRITIAGLITDISIRLTKKDGKTMAVFTTEDQTSSIKCVVFPKEYATISPFLKKGNKVVVKGDINNDADFGMQIITSSVMDIDHSVSDKVSAIYVHLDNENMLKPLKELFKDYAGDIPVKAQIGKKLYDVTTTIATASLFMELQNTYGSSNVLMR